MRFYGRWLILALFLSLLVVPGVVWAQGQPDDVELAFREVQPNDIDVGDTAQVTLAVTGDACVITATGTDIALVVDRSGSMANDNKIQQAVTAAKNFLLRLNFSGDQATVVSFSSDATVDAQLGSALGSLNVALDNLVSRAQTGGETAIGEGVERAMAELNGPRHRSSNNRAMIVLTDGVNTTGRAPVPMADQACNSGIQVFAIGLGPSNEIEPSLVEVPCANRDGYFEAPTGQDLDRIYQLLAGMILGPIGLSGTVVETVPSGLSVVGGSVSSNGIVTGNRITWQINNISQGMTFTYRARAQYEGTYSVGPATISYTTCSGTQETIYFPNRTVRIEGDRPPEVPEPATIALLGGWLAGLAAYARRRRAQQQGPEEPSDLG